MARTRPTTIDQYIDAAAEVARPHLREMMEILTPIAPEGTACIKWGVPIFWDGRVLFGIAAYARHLSFGPGEEAVTRFAPELGGYTFGKGTIQFPYDKPIPADLVRRIASSCVGAP